MRRLNKPYEIHVFEGAGHGFLRQQEGREANRLVAEKAWPLTVAFFRRHLGA
jgi:carboxymethylenebutenolidase